MSSKEAPLIVITGPTASGKTGLALELAERHRGEIICADSRTIYRGMDIGTAKPTKTEQVRVRHHLLDVINPGETYTAADFQVAAYQAIADIRRRNKVPFLVGGTGLYVDAVAREYQWPTTSGHRGDLETRSIEELRTMIEKQHLKMPENSNNKRHLVNALVRAHSGTSLEKPRKSTHVVSITTDKALLRTRIAERARQMFHDGVVEEAQQLAGQYGWESEAMTSNIYPLLRRVIEGRLSEEQVIEAIIVKDWHLAKRQLTWLKRYDFIHWLSLEDARRYIETILE